MATEDGTFKIEVGVFADNEDSYTPHVFTWNERDLDDFWPFVQTFLGSTYPDGYLRVQLVYPYTEEEEK